MQKIYLLLRNNQQSGPFSAEELQTQGLLPADLIWTEGKIGWKSPGDIPGLGKEEKVLPATTQEALSSIQKTKIFVSLPGHSKLQPANPIETESETDPALLLEKKAEALYQKIQAYQEQQSSVPKEELETNYTRSLDDIKNEYAGWLHQQKNKRKFPAKPVLLLAFLIAILIAGFFFYQSPSNNLIENNSPVKFVSSQQSSTIPVNLAVKKNTETGAEKKKNNRITVKKKPVQKTLARTVHPPKAKSVANKAYLPALVTVSGRYKPVGRGVSASEITLQNKSEEWLKVVAVDVIYYRTNGSTLSKETIYFRDISPNASRTLKAPPHEKAEEVKFKMGLISASESGLYYAMN